MLNIKECCRLCMKPKQQSLKMQDCADDSLAVPIRDIFGIELVANGPLSTKICRECIFKVLDIKLFKNTVQNNQASLEESRILQQSLNLIPSEVKQEDDDDVILVKCDPDDSKTLEQPEENIQKSHNVEKEKEVETFALNRPLSLASAESPVSKEIKLKKIKVLIHPISEKDVSQIRLTKFDKRILKLNGKKVEKKSRSKKINQKSWKPTSLFTKNLMSSMASDSDNEYNDDGTIMTLKDYADKYNKKKSTECSEVANESMSSTSGMSTPQKVASLSLLTIPPPTLTPGAKVASKSYRKSYAAKSISSK